MKTPLVSVILPTYNVALYLQQCLESITAQTYKNIEIIVVIDGATDGSYEIAKKYESIDARCRVLYQKNSGSGPARNNGIDNSNGELIAFVDPDDWVKPEYIETLVSIQQSKNLDLVLSGYETHIHTEGKSVLKAISTFPSNLSYENESSVRNHYVDLRCKLKLLNAPWAKLYKASVIKNNNVRFPDLRRSQDIYFNSEYYSYISSLHESTYAGYCYRVLPGENVKKLSADYYKTSEILYTQMKTILGSWGIEYNETEVDNLFFLNILLCYEALLQSEQSLDEIYANEYVRYILNVARPKNIYHSLMRIFLKSKKLFLARCVVCLKKIIK